MTALPPGLARVDAALRWARGHGVEHLDAQCLVAHALGRDRSWVLAHEDAELEPADAQAIAGLLGRRAAGEPYAYLVGEREFHGLTLRVTPDVLIPRPDTETLVDWALECLANELAAIDEPRVLDLGTGSGAIALALKGAARHAMVTASDASPAALAVARANGARLGIDVEWRLGSWWDALAGDGPQHLVLSNPPYVAPGDTHLPALRHEPAAALVPQQDRGDGLADLQRIVAGAAPHLAPGAWLLLEHGAEQGAAVRTMLAQAGFGKVRTRLDLGGRERVSGGVRGG